jgi:tripartite-type tricarboxylate transporter receptor subunit TctC
MVSRRQLLLLSACSAATVVLPRIGLAEVYPSRPIHILVGVTAGSAPDLFARTMAHWLSAQLGQQFVVDNRPGAGTNIATEAVVRAPADGYTLLLIGAPNTINATLYENLSFNFLRDIAPVGAMVDSPEVLVVHPSVQAATVTELIGFAKNNFGKLTMASPGVGSGPHMSGELFKSMAHIEMTHVPYRGGGHAVTDLIAGQVSLMFAAPIVVTEHIRAGKLRALAVTTPMRSHLLPEIPPMKDFLPGYRSGGFFGIGAPKGTPANIVNRLNRGINAGLEDAATKARFTEAGVETLGGSPEDFGKLIAEETDKWARVIRAAGIKAS